jgi:DNA-binding CsgD family transcriptional regulator
MPTTRPLTPRQHRILRAVARGATNKEIAAELGISVQGVKVHVSRLLERYGAGNRVELVSLTRAWSDIDAHSYDAISSDLAGIRATLAKSATGSTGRDQAGAAKLEIGQDRLSAQAPPELIEAVRVLRELLSEVNVAMKLARELPPQTTAGPLVDAIRVRVQAALAQSDAVAQLIERERTGPAQTERSTG